jgi:hypothetical protein
MRTVFRSACRLSANLATMARFFDWRVNISRQRSITSGVLLHNHCESLRTIYENPGPHSAQSGLHGSHEAAGTETVRQVVRRRKASRHLARGGVWTLSGENVVENQIHYLTLQARRLNLRLQPSQVGAEIPGFSI